MQYHYVLLTIAVVVGMVCGALGYFSLSYVHVPQGGTNHEQAGIFVVFASILELLYGYFRPKTPSSTFRMLHPIAGLIIAYTGLGACYLGVVDLGNDS